MRKLNIKSRFKHATSKPQMKADFLSILAVFTWILPATLLGLNGWAGLATSFGLTWVTGAIFGVEGMRRAAFVLAATQIAYTHLSGSIRDLTGKPVWRFDEAGGVIIPPSVNLPASTPGVQGLAEAMQAGAQLARLPDGTMVPAYSGGVNDYLNNYPQATLQGYSTEYSAPKASTQAPFFSNNLFG